MMQAEEESQADRQLSDGSSGDSTATLVCNFLDCVRSRETPLCPLEEGHRSTCFAHLGNIALAVKERKCPGILFGALPAYGKSFSRNDRR